VDIRTVDSTFLGIRFDPGEQNGKGICTDYRFFRQPALRHSKAIRQTIRGWSFQTRSDKELDDLARMFNPFIRGWINYYSHFYKSELYPTFQRIDVHLVRWARRKFKRLRHQPKGARQWLARVIGASPTLFAHWPFLYEHGRALGAV
jgi:hypothetical protein